MGMDPVTIGAAATVAGGLIGADQAKGARKDASNARNAALAQFSNLDVPDIEKMKLALEQYSSAGTLTPEMVELIQQGDTALSSVSTDPRLRQSQLDSLSGLEELATRGMSAGDLAGMELARRNAAAEAQAKQGQILQNMQQRGIGGSGAELLASLTSAQSSADRLQQAQLEEAKARQNARQAALTQQANAAQSLRGQDYNEASAMAQARDQIARFNAANAQNIAQSNVGARNQAQQTNLTNAQNLRNMNTGLSNEQQQFNKQLQQTDFNNRRALAGDRSAALGGAANAADTRAAQTAGMWSQIGQGVGGAVAAYAKPEANSPNTQKLPQWDEATQSYK